MLKQELTGPRSGPDAWLGRLDTWLAPFLAALPRAEQRRWAPLYVRGLLLPGERKSVEPMATRVAPGNVQQLLRERVLRAHEAGEGSQRVLATRFGISVGAVCGWRAAARDEGRRGPRRPGGGRRALGGADPGVLAALVAEHNDLFLAEYARRFAERTGMPVLSAATICRALARLGLRRKQRRSTRASRRARTL
jgi:transposase